MPITIAPYSYDEVEFLYEIVLNDILDDYELLIWLKENMGEENNRWSKKRTRLGGMIFEDDMIYLFQNKEDAMAFKLRWL